MVNNKFTAENIRSLFGSEAAEDEDGVRLKEYYFKNDIYDRVHNDLPIRVLVGHKGIGKSATFKTSYRENKEKKKVCIWVRPDDVSSIAQDSDSSILKLIAAWKEGLIQIIFHAIIKDFAITEHIEKKNWTSGRILSEILQIFKTKLSSVADIDPIAKASIEKYLNTNDKKIYVYIDDLDRGWSGSKQGITRISALLNAVRDLTNDNPGLCMRLSLRSDVYYLSRTSDESTDKIETSVIWYSWTQHELLVMLAKRIQTFLGKKINDQNLLKYTQVKIAELLHDIFEPMYEGKGKWSYVATHRVLASMIRRRPRDLVKLCTMAAESAYRRGHDKIGTDDLEENFDMYSENRLQDTINEYRSELPQIERLLLGMRPSNRRHKERKDFIYTTEELLAKIDSIPVKDKFQFHSGKIATNKELATFMYKINFLVARRKKERSKFIDRRYFEDKKYLSNQFTDFGYQWEVHPAFRWALYPNAGELIFDIDFTSEI